MKDASQLTDLEKIKYVLLGYLKEYLSECNDYNVFANEAEQTVVITARKAETDAPFLMLRLGLSTQKQEIYLYNILLPKEDRGNGLGFGMINVLYNVAKVFQYSLVLHSMTDSFYNAMLSRGAMETSLLDCLVVTDETDLG